ncbi:HAD family hydrolase [Pelosinus propionicus]|uniref:Phosphoglycolate phosphatase, HAD superfamily n=1 Tax=Pelosinus propionicus DSM 13327 TaxID=1123291 RepID=A0A1I4KGC1_9FIRM|nr:HAD hydrolase-like protein [Pelosinus propionicus]SFL77862.1 Phosphoglycolate phosphatase, HAD superfamily [Pelosinus propionicus DSM 13327]
MKILFWDIDGTLLKTAKAGLYAFEEAVSEALHTKVDFTTIKTAGMTDYYISHQILLLATGREPSVHEICNLVSLYEKILPSHLASRKGHLTPSVKDILIYLQQNPDYVSLILTGNTEFGAKAKLRQYELDSFFNFSSSAFCDNCFNRREISKQALVKLQQHYPQVPLDQVYVIGDTPNDIDCGKAIGVQTIAVATGGYTLQELQDHSPWWAVSTLPSPQEFAEHLERRK